MRKSILKFFYRMPIAFQRPVYILDRIRKYYKGGGKKEVEQYFQEHYSSSTELTATEKRVILKDMKRCYIFSLLNPYEYLCYGFDKLPKNKRKEFLSDPERIMYLRKYSGTKNFDILYDKFKFYKRMCQFFKRDVCLVSKDSDRGNFLAFVKNHKRFIVKPNEGSYGKHTTIIELDQKSPDAVFDELLHSGTKWIVEELVKQSEIMAQFNSSSVNTLRIPTFLTKEGIKIAGGFMRTGRKGMVVDNAGAGGIFMSIDENTGTVNSDGANEEGDMYDQHPDSNIAFRGFKIPDWDDLVSIASQCHYEMPEHKYIGWDFAHTDNGWVLIEGNWGQMVGQIPLKEGIKKRFISLIKA